MASVSDNAEGIRLLCSAGIDPLMEDVLEASALRGVATYGSLAALAELSLHTSLWPRCCGEVAAVQAWSQNDSLFFVLPHFWHDTTDGSFVDSAA